MRQSIALSGEKLDFIRQHYFRTYSSKFEEIMSKIFGGYKYTMVKNNYVVDSHETDNIILERIVGQTGDLDGISRELFSCI